MPSESTRADGPSVIALLLDQGRIARVRAAFGNQAVICESSAQLLAMSRAQGVKLILIAPVDRTGESLTTTVAAIRASRQSPPVHVYGDRSIECVRQLMPLARAGARGVVLFDVDDDAVSLRGLLKRGNVADAIEALIMVVQQVVPTRHRPLLMFCTERIADPPSAVAFARALNVSRRTLSAWARQAGARGVRAMTSKCRVLVALEMIRASDRSIEQVAHELRFASSAHLHNTIRRYTGRLPRDAARDDSASWCQRFFPPSRDGPVAVPPPAENRQPRGEWSTRPNDMILPSTNQGIALRST